MPKETQSQLEKAILYDRYDTDPIDLLMPLLKILKQRSEVGKHLRDIRIANNQRKMYEDLIDHYNENIKKILGL